MTECTAASWAEEGAAATQVGLCRETDELEVGTRADSRTVGGANRTGWGSQSGTSV